MSFDLGVRLGKQHAAGGGVTKDGGVVSAECLESISYGGLKSEKMGTIYLTPLESENDGLIT